MPKFITYIFILLFFNSCKDEYTICDLPTIVRMKCAFYKNAGGTQSESIVPMLKVTRIPTIYPDYDATGISNFSLALNPIIDSVQYQVSIDAASVPDTVTFVYTSQKINISAICGDVYVNNLTRINTTANTLDSVKISNKVVNTTSGENVRIYF